MSGFRWLDVSLDMRRSLALPLVAMTVALTSVACGDSPAAPSPRLGVTVTRLEIVGTDTVEPGRSVQLSVTATLSDGTSHNVTGEVSWESSHRELMIVTATGLVSAGHQLGESKISVRYTGRFSTGSGTESSSRQQFVLPAGTYRLTGLVKSDGALVDGARVELTTQLETLTTETAMGSFVVYGVAGDVEIRVTKAEYETTIRRTTITSHRSEEFDLLAFSALLDVRGNFTMRIAAAADCRAGLPEHVRERTYAAMATQKGPAVTVSLGRDVSFGGTAERNRVLFLLRGYGSNPWNPPSSIFEHLTAGMSGTGAGGPYVAIYGSVVVTPAGSGYAGTLDGSIDVLLMDGYWDYGGNGHQVLASCKSATHQFNLAR